MLIRVGCRRRRERRQRATLPRKAAAHACRGWTCPVAAHVKGRVASRRVSVHGARGLALTGTVGRSDRCALVAFASLATALSSRRGDHRPRGSAPAGRTRARQKFQLPAHAQRVDARRANGRPRPLVYCPVTTPHATWSVKTKMLVYHIYASSRNYTRYRISSVQQRAGPDRLPLPPGPVSGQTRHDLDSWTL